MQTPEALRKQAATLKQTAQYASGPAYHQDMQRVQALLTQANELEQQNATKQQNNNQRANNLRRKDLAKIHLLSKQAGLDDEGRRDMMEHITRKRSCAKMNSFERGKVISHLQNSVPKKTKTYPGKPNNIDRNPQLQKIEALLAEANYPWSYAKGIAKRMFKKEQLEFCSSNQLSGIIAALIKDANKHGRRTS